MQLNDPAIVPFRGHGEGPDGPFLVFDLYDGGSLRELLDERRGPLTLDEVLTLSRRLLGVLARAHGQKLLHRDIKPENIVLATRGDVSTAALCDFGLAYLVTHSVAGSSLVVGGTLGYASPQQLVGQNPEPTDDVYSVAIVIGECLVGTSKARSAETPTGSRVDLEILRGSVTGPLRSVVRAATALDRKPRPRDAAALLAGIEQAMRRQSFVGRLAAATRWIALVALASLILWPLGVLYQVAMATRSVTSDSSVRWSTVRAWSTGTFGSHRGLHGSLESLDVGPVTTIAIGLYYHPVLVDSKNPAWRLFRAYWKARGGAESDACRSSIGLHGPTGAVRRMRRPTSGSSCKRGR